MQFLKRFYKYITDRPEILGLKEGVRVNKMSFVKGMSIGMAAGAAIGMLVMPKKQKSTVGKALRSVGNVVDSVAGAIGM